MRRDAFLPALLAATVLFLTPAVQAQVDLTRLSPLGGRRGETVTLTLGAEKLPETGMLVVDGAGVRPLGPFTKGVGKVEIAADAPPGPAQMRLVGAEAVTTPRNFTVGALPEVTEKEPNDRRDQAQRLESFPITLNGSLPKRADIDSFSVPLKKGECLVVAGESRALGTPTNLVVRILDSTGRELLVQMDSRTRDPLLGFTAPADGDYVVELREVMNNYSGINDDYVYRVTLTKGPWLDRVSPPGAQRGQKARLTFLGWNLNGGTGPSNFTMEVDVPATAGERFPVSAGGALNSVRLVVGDVPEQEEREPDSLNAPQTLSIPGTVSGRFERPDDTDVYRIHTGATPAPLRIVVEAAGLGSTTDPVLEVRKPDGTVLSTTDDAEGGRDPILEWTPPANEDLLLVLRDLSSARARYNGNDFYYRLTCAPAGSRLRLSTPAPQVILPAGGSVEVPVTVRRARLNAATEVKVEGLPEGISATTGSAPPAPDGENSAEVKLKLTATAAAKAGWTELRLVATGGPLRSIAEAKWVLAKDRSGTLEEGRTKRIGLLVTPLKPAEKVQGK